MEILHDFNLQVGRQQSLCLIGPNGAGKSTVLHSIFGFTNIFSGSIVVGEGDNRRDVTKLTSSQKLREAGIAYILQDKSIFPGMTVEENLWMGGYLMSTIAEAKIAAEKIFDKYPRLAERRKHRAGVLSGGERRLLEISRALVMEPDVLLVDEPSIGLEPRFIEMVFEILVPAKYRRQDHHYGGAKCQERPGICGHWLRTCIRGNCDRRHWQRIAEQPRSGETLPWGLTDPDRW